MKSLKAKIISLIVVCTVLASLIAGTMSLYNSAKIANADSEEKLQQTAQLYGKDIDARLSKVEHEINTLADVTVRNIGDFGQFQTDPEYVRDCTRQVESFALESAANTEGVLTYYIQYNPEIEAVSGTGVYATRASESEDFRQRGVRELVSYAKEDTEHTGWYYTAVNAGKAVWMDPYANTDMDTNVISYVVPLTVSGVSVGVVGMDVSLDELKQISNRVKCYDGGYGFLVDSENRLLTHPKETYGDSLEKCDAGLASYVASGRNETIKSYSYGGESKEAAYVTLTNGMKLVVTAPLSEIRANSTQLFYLMLAGTAAAVVIAVVIAFIFSIRIVRPIKHLTEIVSDTAALNFAKNPKSMKLVKMKDETGNMARAVQKMRSRLREMVALIDRAGLSLDGNVTTLNTNVGEVTDLCSNNSATTEQLAAAMEEAASATDNVNIAVHTVNTNAKNIEELSKKGTANSQLVKERADSLKKTTQEAAELTTSMYEDVRTKTRVAMEQAKAVEKINELTRNIMEISDQTNLLALNASIEAVRAGEAGKGFAVVASEIGALANQTQETVGDIDGIISQVNRAVDNMVACMDDTIDFLEKTVLRDYNSFMEVGENYSEDASNYEQGMVDISEAVQALVSAIADISFSIREINDTVNESAVGVTEIADKTSEMVQKLGATESFVKDSKTSAEDLNQIVREFDLGEYREQDENDADSQKQA